MISSYVHQGHRLLRRWALDPAVQRVARWGVHVLAGFCLSAAGLQQGMLPLVMGLVWACRGWQAVLVACGGILGYGLFWGSGSLQAIFWTGLALLGVLLLGDRPITRQLPALIPATGMLMVSATGLGFQLLAGDNTPIPLYLIRVALGGAAPWLFTRWLEKREPVTAWFCWSLLTLGLAQIVPVRWLGLGYLAAGVAAVRMAFPCAALTGLALDLAGITSVPMTAVTVLAWCVRFLPRYPGWVSGLAPGCMGVALLYFSGSRDLLILPGLFLGGLVACVFTDTRKTAPRRGETGTVQVRLEMAAGVLSRTCRLFQGAPERMVDEEALVLRAVSEACAGCAARDHCRDMRRLQQLPGNILRKPLLTAQEVPARCRKGSRVLAELRRAQEQLRTLQADRLRQQEYRAAVVQQYGFLSDFLQKLSDDLSRRGTEPRAVYDPVVSVCGNRRKGENGDRCAQFAGVGNQYYIILCDGMGTGPGAVGEAEAAIGYLRQLLSCGFPAEHALQSLNSLCALGDRAAAVTVDLAELALDTGTVTLYKWGTGASYLLTASGVEKLGSASPPPGLSVTEGAQVRCSFLMRRGQTLLLVSDGIEEEAVLELCARPCSGAVLAEELLKRTSGQDDATVVTVHLLWAKP